MTLALFATKRSDRDGPTSYFLHTTALGARVRAAELLGCNVARVLAEAQPAVIRRRRCNRVGIALAWCEADEQYHVQATYDGERRYLTVGRSELEKLPPEADAAVDAAARAAISFLIDKDDMDHELVAWDRGREKPRLQIERR